MSIKGRIGKRILFAAAVCIFALAVWKLFVSEGTRPVEQLTKDGWFEGRGSQIREIRLRADALTFNGVGERSEFTVWITDAEGCTIWQKSYYHMLLEHQVVVVLEQFERGEGIDIGTGRYQIHNTLSEDTSIAIMHKILTYDGGYGVYYGACGLIALAALALILILTMSGSGDRKLAVYFFAALVLMGILYTAVMPPLTVPDEESHFLNAYDMASKMIFQEKLDGYGHRIMRATDADSIVYLHSAASIGRWYSGLWEKADAGEMVTYAAGSSVSDSTPGYVYLFPAIGIAFARICQMNGHWMLLMGRLFNLIGTAFLMAVSLYLVPFGKKFFCLLGLLPEVVYLSASYSYDALNFALCFLAAAYFFYMIDGEKRVKPNQLAVFIGIVLIMAPIKIVYLTFLGLLLLIPSERLDISRRLLMISGAGMILAGAVFLLCRGGDILVLLKGLEYNTEEARVSLRYILDNPISVAHIFIYNLMENADYYVRSVMGEFVGRDRYEVLLDIAYLPEWMMVLWGILLAMGIYTDQGGNMKLWKRSWMVLIALVSSFLFMLSMYLANNTVNMKVIHGVQGRYFLPLLLLLPAIAGRERAKCFEQEGRTLLTQNSCIIVAVGMDIMAILIQLQHIALDYYA